MTGFATLAMINIDCADPQALAAFYHEVLGWEVTHSEEYYSMITDGTTSIGFGKVDDHRAPGWPDGSVPKQFHLDLYVDDLDEAEARCLKLGATRPEPQPTPERWRVLLDPAGRPFDLCLRS